MSAFAASAPVPVGAEESQDSKVSLATAAEKAAAGKVLFAANGCGWCHEGGGRRPGRGPQLMNTERDDAFIAGRIQGGKPGRMPAFANSFSVEQIEDLIAFIRSIKPEAGK